MENTNQNLDHLIETLQAKRTRLADKLAEADKQLEAAKLTKSLLCGGEVRENEEIPLPAISNRELQGLTQLQALVYVARKNSGRVRTANAVQVLIRAGLMKQTKNSYGIVYTVIRRSEKFKPSGIPGEYELIEEEMPVISIRKASGN